MAMDADDPQVEHIPVLAEALAERIDMPQDGVMVDATIGHGGHSLLFGEGLGPSATLVGLDVDEKALLRAAERLKGLLCKVVLLRCNFREIAEQLDTVGIGPADFILADLGINSAQLADPQRGLSFQVDMPLDMRIDKRIETTAADIVNGADEKALADLIYEFGQERGSRRIARFIVQHRKSQPITTTARLASIVAAALARPGAGWQRIHPATRTFQALRIAVNHELENLKALLDAAPQRLKPGGQLAVISFHSLEDGMVKADFKANAAAGVYDILTKKPIAPDRCEAQRNRRARSAKLRIARKR